MARRNPNTEKAAPCSEIYWPIVSVHGLSRESQRACEEVCDNVVLAHRNAISYGETLLHVAELLVQARPMDAAVGIIGGQGELERRVAQLIDPRRNTMTRTSRSMRCDVPVHRRRCDRIGNAVRGLGRRGGNLNRGGCG